MTARQRRFWWAAGILGALLAGVTIAYVWATDTVRGRQWLTVTIVNAVDDVFDGRATLRIGTLREVGWGRVQLDSVVLLDASGEPVLIAGTVEGSLDVMALLDKVVHLRYLDVANLSVDMRKDFTGPWNLAYIISGDTTPRVPGPPGYSDNIRIDAIRLSRGRIVTTAPWAPYPVFTGRARDSVIALRDSLHDLTVTPQGFLERREVHIDWLAARDGIITQPFGAWSSLQIDTLTGTVSDPPVRVINTRGRVQWTPDSLELALPTVVLPASTGSAAGRVWWNQPGAVRFDVNINATAGLSDLQWVWDVLPATGGGTAKVRMRTLESADDAEYTLSDLDVTSGESRITGNIAVTVRPAVFELHGVNLSFTPLTSDLMRRLSYEAVPETVNGTLTGTLVATRGGPLTDFLIDRLDARFADANVPDAVSILRARGTVAMGVEPAARNFRIDTVRADLRSVAALLPDSLLRHGVLDGTLSGTGRIVSANLRSMHASDLALLWTDAVGNMSALRGDVLYGFGETTRAVEAGISLDPISMKALSRVDSTMVVQSNIAGRVEARGSLDSLDWTANLHTVGRPDSPVALRGTASLKADAWSVSAIGTMQGFNAQAWTGRNDLPVTALSGDVSGRARGTSDSLGTINVRDAQVAVALKQVEADERPAFDILGAMVLDSTILHVDSATVHIGGVTLEARGALARSAPSGPGSDSIDVSGARVAVVVESDTLEVSASADTLRNVRGQLSRLAAMIEPMDSAQARTLREFAADSLDGDASVSGYVMGSLDDFNATLALGGRNLQVGAIHLGRLFGSLRAENVLTRAAFEGVATADDVDGIGAVRVVSSEFRVQRANPDSGQLVFDANSGRDSRLVIRGGYRRENGALSVVADSLRFNYDSVLWRAVTPIRVVSDSQGIRVDSMQLRSSADGVFRVVADVPTQGDIRASVQLENFPVGEAAAFALGTSRFSGLLTGDVELRGTRALPLLNWRIDADSLGVEGSHLPRVLSVGEYANKKIEARAVIQDSIGGLLKADARVPFDMTLGEVEKRLLSDVVDADISADSLRLDALGLAISGVTRIKGTLSGHVAVAGTMDRPVASGTMQLRNFSAYAPELGIEPVDGRATIRAAEDSVILESFRMRSGGVADTLNVRGSVRFVRDEPLTVNAAVHANNFVASRQRNGNDLVVSGNLDVRGELKKPAISGNVFVPSATLVIDPLGASTALDLRSAAAREYLSESELPVVDSTAPSLAGLGQYATVSNLRVQLGNEVWVRTPESTLRLVGSVDLSTKGDVLVPEGEIQANRGLYRLELGVVSRSFAVDSGRVRFFGDTTLIPTLDISATNVVRLSSGDEIPVGIHVGGNLEAPVLKLSSTDPLYSSAPESEIISLLIFGAPTFALDGQSQSTVRAVTGVLLPTLGGAVEGALQQLVPFLNTVQLTNVGGQSGKEIQDDPANLLNNLSLMAGKQIGDRTYLRANTGVCRGNNQTAGRNPLWLGLSVEYRLSRGFTGQIGYDPGSSPCTKLGNDALPNMQLGFDLFKEWIF
jgi:translocation and assembly module TamB